MDKPDIFWYRKVFTQVRYFQCKTNEDEKNNNNKRMKLIAGEHRVELAREKMFQVGNNKSNTRWTSVIKPAEKFLNGLTRGMERYM